MSDPVPAPAQTQTKTIATRASTDAAIQESTVAILDGERALQEQAAKDAEARLQILADQGDISQANAATGVYGDSGTGKTSLIATAVEYAWEVFHRTSHINAIDPGGFGNKLLRLIRLKIATVYNPTTHIEPFETMEFISHGYRPERILDPFTGIGHPNVRLVPPQQTRWVVYCPKGHAHLPVTDRKTLNGYQRACPVCKEITTINNWTKVDEITVRSPGSKHIGLYAFDSGTAAQSWVMNDMALRAGRDELGGEKGAISKIVSGSLVLGSNNRAHYGFAQNQMEQWIKNSRKIPGQVVPPIWTFLENRATDEGGVPIFGPKIAGQAKTTDVASWVGNLLRSSKEVGNDAKEHFRLYTTIHMKLNEGNIPHLAKTRAEPGTLPPYLEDKEGEPEFTRCSLKYFFITLDQALAQSAQIDANRYIDAPLFQPFEDDQVEELVSSTPLSEGDAPTVVNRVLPSQGAGVARPVAVAAGAVAGRPALPGASGTVTPKVIVPAVPAAAAVPAATVPRAVVPQLPVAAAAAKPVVTQAAAAVTQPAVVRQEQPKPAGKPVAAVPPAAHAAPSPGVAPPPTPQQRVAAPAAPVSPGPSGVAPVRQPVAQQQTQTQPQPVKPAPVAPVKPVPVKQTPVKQTPVASTVVVSALVAAAPVTAAPAPTANVAGVAAAPVVPPRPAAVAPVRPSPSRPTPPAPPPAGKPR